MYINIILVLKLFINIFLNNSHNSYHINKINNVTYCNNITKWNNHKKDILNIKNFKANGILIYKNGIKRIFLNFHWDNIYQKYFSFKAYTFFGMKLIELIYNTENIYIKKFGKKIIKNNNSKNFLENANSNIPIKNLRFWLIGLPGDSKEFILDKKGFLKEVKYKFNNKNYKIIYIKYNKKINPPLPINIELYHENSKITLKIKNWIL